MSKRVQTAVRSLSLALLLLGLVVSTLALQRSESQRSLLKEELVELSSIKYGLFNVDEWKRIVVDIISDKLKELRLEGQNRLDMEEKISGLLHKLINDFEAKTRQENQKKMLGFLKTGLSKFFGVFERMRRQVPEFTQTILDYSTQPENQAVLKQVISQQLDDYAAATFAQVDYSTHNAILAQHGKETREDCMTYLKERLADINAVQQRLKWLLMGLSAVLAFLLIGLNNISRLEFLLFIGCALALLMAGLRLPMIEIDARIAKMSFQLLDEEVSFYDQVLYYKCKSIGEVVRLMLFQPKADVFAVGLLVLAFSVLFPLLKLLCTVLFLFVPRLRQQAFVGFMVFKSGKWSMADVMVVAIFMAYIGFSGILGEQLGQLEVLSPNIELLSTNESSLMLGFFAFSSFAVVSLLISQQLQRLARLQ